ncbi:MAG: YkgJ family cysteine cluster protein [Acidilobaceae archaeon]|nr:YkgJ family cysteine cluster protein [Acidilobaceae archaeon]MCX8165274.1 YkgJ family cysteine cluster protein [Acidilobaceae archaeon]MDW7973700.1 YkgJ family cysteine cluster protein [Sulfolobales archaeon]
MGKLAQRLSFVNFGEVCRNCPVNCCKRFYAVLLEEEESEFDGKASIVKTRLGRLKTLGGPRGRTCPFLLENGFCGVYDRRPFDCRLWPVMVYYDFEREEFIIVLDMECPAAAEGRIPKEMLNRMIQTAREAILDGSLKKEWVKKYTLSPWPKNYQILERVKPPS